MNMNGQFCLSVCLSVCMLKDSYKDKVTEMKDNKYFYSYPISLT